MNHRAADRRNAQHVPSLSPSLREIAHRRLRSACSALGANHLLGRALDAFDLIAGPWGSWRAEHEPHWQSDVTDDGSPFEISVAFSGKTPELRLLAECQERPLTSESAWNAGLALNARLAHEFGADLSR